MDILDMNTDVLEPFLSNTSQVSEKTFKEQTSDYIDALTQFLEDNQLDIPVESDLEAVVSILTDVIEHLY